MKPCRNSLLCVLLQQFGSYIQKKKKTTETPKIFDEDCPLKRHTAMHGVPETYTPFSHDLYIYRETVVLAAPPRGGRKKAGLTVIARP